MSYRIVYDLAAVRLPAATLRPYVADSSFHADQYLLMELGGDNNVYEGRGSLRARSWSLIGAGQNWEIMRQVVQYAASCEGGGMRFSGASETQAETYIRKCRTVLRDAVAALSAIKAPEMTGETPVWSWLNLLRDPKDAAIFLAYSNLDDAPVYNRATVYGPCHERHSIMKGLTPFVECAA
ncbi:MAG: hypothetical protein ABF572_10750 [Gluconobacter sp.]|uniref:hypothetical protein n=1 Tax=Gluconobacter TaxID=441 RepID=UPI001B8C0461|nr:MULTISPECIES: hypothetical protein [Gluconobacter]MBS1080906.1 hypothetical protein [Gluconobacter kondonii]MBS1104002.1 hypothetical protein [Gluconobacter sp. Dm-62]